LTYENMHKDKAVDDATLAGLVLSSPLLVLSLKNRKVYSLTSNFAEICITS